MTQALPVYRGERQSSLLLVMDEPNWAQGPTIDARTSRVVRLR